MFKRDDIVRHFRGKNILVTGGLGFIGRNIIFNLRDTGAPITIVV